MEHLKKLLESKPSPRILDLATGQGNFIHLITSLTDQYGEIIGVDHNERALEAARGFFKDERIQFKTLDIRDMALEKASFDIVVLSNSLHHLEAPHEVMDQMIPLLKKDGILLFNEMYHDTEDPGQMTHTLLHHFWAKIDTLKGVVHKETMTQNEILDLLSSHPNLCVDRSWTMVVEDRDLSKEDYTMLKGSLDRTLERIKDHPDYETYAAEAEILRDRLDTIGFKSAAQLITICKSQ